MFLTTCLLSAGCRSSAPLGAADLSAPGWRSWEGQAVWKPNRNRPELAGELMAAARTNGDFFVQFAKPPFMLATAQTMEGRWQIEFGQAGRGWSGKGEPPSRFVWFELGRILKGRDSSRNWRRTGDLGGMWRLENLRTGETLEGRFFP